jgi:hypothetical protein
LFPGNISDSDTDESYADCDEGLDIAIGLLQPPVEDKYEMSDEDGEGSGLGDDQGVFSQDFTIEEILELNYPSQEEVIMVVQRYAYNEGFVAHKETKKSNSKGEVIGRVFSCHRKGRCSKKTDTGSEYVAYSYGEKGEEKPDVKVVHRKERKNNQCDCKWRIQFSLDSTSGYWKASATHHLEHNHELLMEKQVQGLGYYRRLPEGMMELINGMVEDQYDIDPFTVYKRLQVKDGGKEQGGITESRPQFLRMDIRNALYKARRHYRDSAVHNYAQKVIERLQGRSKKDPQFQFQFRNGKYIYILIVVLTLLCFYLQMTRDGLKV